MNHTTLGIAAIIAVAALTAGAFVVSTAYAGKSYGGDGDKVIIKSKFNQKNLCWAVDDSTTTCSNRASVFGDNGNRNNGNQTGNDENHGRSRGMLG
jgi:hypothetical protein